MVYTWIFLLKNACEYRSLLRCSKSAMALEKKMFTFIGKHQWYLFSRKLHIIKFVKFPVNWSTEDKKIFKRQKVSCKCYNVCEVHSNIWTLLQIYGMDYVIKELFGCLLDLLFLFSLSSVFSVIFSYFSIQFQKIWEKSDS